MSDARDADGPPPEGRTQTGRAVVLVVVVALVAIVVLAKNPSGAAHTSTAPTVTTTTLANGGTRPTSTTTTTVPVTHPDATVTVQVLNGLQSGSLAGNLSNRLHTDHGYATLAPNDTTSVTDTSVIYVARTGYYGDARKLAGYLGLPVGSIRRQVPTSAPIPAGVLSQADLVVVIGLSLQSVAS